MEGEMWRYQRPRFEALLVEQLQRQQCRSEFCDTVLRSEGVSIPAHSCVLSALSPLFSRTLSTAPTLSPGQKHLLEFQAVGPSVMLKLVGFLYSGELQGTEESERQEVMSVLHQLGISELVELVGVGAVSEQERPREREEEMEEEGSKDGWMGGEGGKMLQRVLDENEMEEKGERGRAGEGGRVREGGMEEEGVREGGTEEESEREGGGGRCREIGMLTEALEDKRSETWKDGKQRRRGEEDLSSGTPGLSLASPLVSEYIPKSALHSTAPTPGDHLLAADHGMSAATRDRLEVNSKCVKTVVGEADAVMGGAAPMLAGANPMLGEAKSVVGGADSILGGAGAMVRGGDPMVVPLLPLGPTVSLSHVLLLPAAQDYVLATPTSLCLDTGDALPALPAHIHNRPPSVPPSALPQSPQTEFRRFEGNIPGFINYFLNSEEELGPMMGGGCRVGAGTCITGRKQGRQKKEGEGEERKADAHWEVPGMRSGNGAWRRGCRERAWGVGHGKIGRGGGVEGSCSNVRAEPSDGESIKIRFKRRSEMWELVSVEEEGRIATPRGRVSRGRQRAGRQPQRGSGTNGREHAPCRTPLNQDGFPIIKRQRGRPRVRPLPFPALPCHLFKALTLSPPSDHPPSTSSTSFPPTVGPTPNLSPAPDLLHTLPLPPPLPLEVDESDEQIEKLLEDVMMGLNFFSPITPAITQTEGTYGNGLIQERPHQTLVEAAAASKLTAAGDTVLIDTAPCTRAAHPDKTTSISSVPVCANPSIDAVSPKVPQPITGELGDVLNNFLWTFENQTGETLVKGAGYAGNSRNATLVLGSEPGSCLGAASGPSAVEANPHADLSKTSPAVAYRPGRDESPCSSPVTGPISTSNSGSESRVRNLQNCFATGHPGMEVHPELPSPSPEPQGVPALKCMCAPTLQREGTKAEQVPPKFEQPLGSATCQPMGFQHQSLGDSASWSTLQPSLSLPKWLSPIPVGLQFPLSFINRTSASHPTTGSPSVVFQNPRCYNLSCPKKRNGRCGHTRRLAGHCSPRKSRPEKRGSCRMIQVEDERTRAVTRRQSQERKRTDKEEGGDDEVEGRGNSIRRRRYLKRRVDGPAQALEGAADWDAWKSKAKHAKYNIKSETLSQVEVSDKARTSEGISCKGGNGWVELGKGHNTGDGAEQSGSMVMNGGTVKGGDVSMCTTVCLVRRLSNNVSREGPSRDSTNKSPRDSTEKPSGDSAGKPLRNSAEKLPRDSVEDPPRNPRRPKSPTLQMRKTAGGAILHMQERVSKGGVMVTEAESRPRERKERGRLLRERVQRCRDEGRGAGVQSNAQRQGRKRKREKSATTSNVRLRAVHAGKTQNLNEETSLDTPGSNLEPKSKRGGLSWNLHTGQALGEGSWNSTRSVFSSAFQKMRELLGRSSNRRERKMDSRGERERESKRGENERGRDWEREREKQSKQDGEKEKQKDWEGEERGSDQDKKRERRSKKAGEEIGADTEKNGRGEMTKEETATRPVEGTTILGKLTDVKEKKAADKMGPAELNEQRDELTLKGRMKNSARKLVGEGQGFGSVEEEADVIVEEDGGERRSCSPRNNAPTGQPGVLQPQFSPVSNRKPPDIFPGREETESKGMWKQRMLSVELCEKKLPLSYRLAVQILPSAQEVHGFSKGSTGSLELEEEEDIEVNVLDCSSPSPLPIIMMPGMWAEGINTMTSSEEEEEGDIDVTGEVTD